MVSVSLRKAQKKYRRTANGRAANNRCASNYYYKNKQRILARNKETVECFFCGAMLSKQYYRNSHLLTCVSIN